MIEAVALNVEGNDWGVEKLGPSNLELGPDGGYF